MINKIIANKNLHIALFFLVMQQLIVASSTYFIASLAKNLTTDVSLLYAVLFVVSLLVVYIPAYFCVTHTDYAKSDIYRIYNDDYNQAFLGKSSLLSDDELRGHATTMLAQESGYTLAAVVDSIFDVIALILNLLFNVLVITWFLDGTLLFGYAVGIICAFVFVHFNRSALNVAAKTDQKARLDLTSKLFDNWDNVVIFNKYNYKIYNNAVQESFSNAKQSSFKSEGIRHINSSLGMVVLMIPVFLTTAFIFQKNWHDASVMAVLVATLPRQIQLLQMSYQLISYHTSVSVIKTMLDGVLEVLVPPCVDLDEYIKNNQIKVKQTGSVFDREDLPEKGRITLTGNNGVGKSCLLLKLKEHYQDNAYYLPAKHDLYFDYKKDIHKGSTGQQLMKQIKEIEKEDGSPIVILDEWDAHLDSLNTKIIDGKLDELSQLRLVIEVRH